MAITQREATEADAGAAALLVRHSFEELAAADWEPHARAVFLVEASAAALRSAIAGSAYAAVAFDEKQMVGFLVMKGRAVLSLLFVHPSHVRRGIGRMMWERARSELETKVPNARTVELNATPNSVDFYRRLGFVPISREFTTEGCRATRMACWLPARSLGAELAP